MQNTIHEFYETHKNAEIKAPINRFTQKPEIHLLSPFNSFLSDYPEFAAGNQTAEDKEFSKQRLKANMMACKSGVTRWQGVTVSAATIAAQEAVKLEEEAAEVLRLEEVAAKQVLADEKKKRLLQPSLLMTKAAELKLTRRRTAQVSVLIKESMTRLFFHEVVSQLKSHGMDPTQAIDDALEMFGDRILYSGDGFRFNDSGFHLDDLEIR